MQWPYARAQWDQAVTRAAIRLPAGKPAGSALPSDPQGELRPIYTMSEAAHLLRVPEGWLRKKVTAGSVPHTRLGKHVRFTDAHLRQIIAAGEQPATPHGGLQGLSPRARRPGPVVP